MSPISLENVLSSFSFSASCTCQRPECISLHATCTRCTSDVLESPCGHPCSTISN